METSQSPKIPGVSRAGEDGAEESLPIGRQAWETASTFKKLYMYGCLAGMYVCASFAWLVSRKPRKKY